MEVVNLWNLVLNLLVKRDHLTLTLPGPSAGVSGSLDSYCSLKPLCSGMGEVVPARSSPTLLPHPLALCCHCPVSKCRSASIVVTSTVRVNCGPNIECLIILKLIFVHLNSLSLTLGFYKQSCRCNNVTYRSFVLWSIEKYNTV